jgi:hypothetical protein
LFLNQNSLNAFIFSQIRQTARRHLPQAGSFHYLKHPLMIAPIKVPQTLPMSPAILVPPSTAVA